LEEKIVHGITEILDKGLNRKIRASEDLLNTLIENLLQAEGRGENREDYILGSLQGLRR
jgi:hypothetical protein